MHWGSFFFGILAFLAFSFAILYSTGEISRRITCDICKRVGDAREPVIDVGWSFRCNGCRAETIVGAPYEYAVWLDFQRYAKRTRIIGRIKFAIIIGLMVALVSR